MSGAVRRHGALREVSLNSSSEPVEDLDEAVDSLLEKLAAKSRNP